MSIESKLGKWDLTMMVISFIIGVGIFFTPSTIAAKAGTPFIFYASWVVGGFISVCGALTFAEIGSRLPAAGGYYKIFSHCYHPAFAFMANLTLVTINAGSAVAVAILGAEYIQPIIVPPVWQSSISTTAMAFIIVSFLFVLNYLGIKMGARVQNFLSGLKILMILLLSLAVFGSKSAINPTVIIHQSATTAIAALGLCLVSVFFSCGGYQNTINMGADIKNPQRNIPFAIIGGMFIVVTLYLLINIAYVQVIGFDNLKGKNLLVSELAKVFFGDVGFKIASVVVFTSVLGFLNASLMSNPRIFYAMAEDGTIPAIFKKVNHKTQIQEFGLSLFFVIILITLFFVKDKDVLVNYIIFIDNLSLVFATITIFLLRKQMKDTNYTGYRMKLYPLIPIIFMVVLLFVCANIFIANTEEALVGLAIFLGAYPLYLVLKRIS
jgi:basic amino acid/polyamine antiporter, APA family